MISWSSIRNRLVPYRSNVFAGLTGLLTGTAAGFILILWIHQASPVVIYSAYELGGVVPRSGHLDLLFDIDRTRDCPSQTSRWLWTWIERKNAKIKQYFPLINSNIGVSDTGDTQRFVISFQLPPGVWPGDWFYTAKTVERCSIIPGIENSRILQTPDIPVHVVDDP